MSQKQRWLLHQECCGIEQAVVVGLHIEEGWNECLSILHAKAGNHGRHASDVLRFDCRLGIRIS